MFENVGFRSRRSRVHGSHKRTRVCTFTRIRVKIISPEFSLDMVTTVLEL